MEKHFMIDIETTGIDPATEDLLQIGILECTWHKESGFWIPGREFELLQHTDREPKSEFAIKHMRELYETCNRAPEWKPENIRWMMLQYFKLCGAMAPDVYLMGWNASNFDIPFLEYKGCLEPSRYVTKVNDDGSKTDTRVGDYHYRLYEIGGAVSLAQNVCRELDRRNFLDKLNAALETKSLVWDGYVHLPDGKEHDAVFDCYKQLRLLNGLIALGRGELAL